MLALEAGEQAARARAVVVMVVMAAALMETVVAEMAASRAVAREASRAVAAVHPVDAGAAGAMVSALHIWRPTSVMSR